MAKDDGRVPDGTGLSSPAETQSSQGLGPTGFDPSRMTLAICGTEPCEHDFAAWRGFDDGGGAELFCSRCGLGAMAHSLISDF